MPVDVSARVRQRRVYPKLWGYSVTRVSYRLGKLGWDSELAHATLEKILECSIELSTVRTGVSDGKNLKYEKGNAASLSPEQITELNRVAGRVNDIKSAIASKADLNYPEEILSADPRVEGACRTIIVNAYERDRELRDQCIMAHGTNCAVCGVNFGEVYGVIAQGLIHVHHLRPLSEIRAAHAVDPVEDLRPVCPNCHAVLHLRIPAYSIEDVREFLQKNGT